VAVRTIHAEYGEYRVSLRKGAAHCSKRLFFARTALRRHLGNALSVVRWWFELCYLIAGIGAVVAGPVMIARGDYGGVYMLIGGAALVALGFVVHPSGCVACDDRRRDFRLCECS
jgi:hypothetical protein